MPTISGIEVRELHVNLNGSNPLITTKFKPSLPVLIDITATTASGHSFGRAIINDNDPTNNQIELVGFKDLIDQVIWLRIIVHHPALNKYDFKIYMDQGDANLATYDESGTLTTSDFIYEGFVLKGA